MKFSYRFSNLLGSVYRKGNLLFTPDGNSVLSPVGNRVTVFDLKNNKSETLPITTRLNITCLALSPDGYTLIVVDEDGEAYLISLLSKTVLHTYHFHRPIHAIKFSPDGSKFAVTRENKIQVFHAPGKKREYNPFVLWKTFFGAYDETTCIDWTTDSKAFCVGAKDMSVRVYGAERFVNLIIYSLGGHNDEIVGTYFEKNSLNVYSVCGNGIVRVWECDTGLDGLVKYTPPEKKTLSVEIDDISDNDENGEEEEKGEDVKMTKDDETKMENKILYKGKGKTSKIMFMKIEEGSDSEENGEEEEKGTDVKMTKDDETKMENKILYKGKGKFNFKRSHKREKLTSTAFHKDSRILICGFDNGSFYLHEMPEFNLIHSLNISEESVAAIDINKSGDWIAFGCSGLGQLLVWEWQSETYILKQQGHFNNMNCIAYSPDGQNLATGGDDGKVKLWNTGSGFCFVTFDEHLGAITGVTFNQKGQVVLSASLDGTVRAFDLNRYRNFRTFTTPRPTQFSCLTIDASGDIVCAGSKDLFEIYVWSMQTGKLLEILTGHEGPVCSLSFSPTQALLVSGSWDKTVKLWDVFEKKGSKETLSCLSDVLAVAFRPDGGEVAIATLSAQIIFWDPIGNTQTGSIEGRHDLGYSRKELDKITAKKSAFGKAFNTLCYSADGQCVLAAGQSKNVCIYSVGDQMLIKKFEISCNMSFDGMEEFLDKRKMTEFGSLALVDQNEDTSIKLPGVKKGEMSSRHWRPEVRVSCVQFSPTGRAWAATTTEGLLIYSLDHNLVFDPFELEMEITPANVKKTLRKGEYSTALMLSFRLNEQSLIQEALENVPVGDVDVICEILPDMYIDKLLTFLGSMLESSAHIEFYLIWIQRILMKHGPKLKQRSQKIMPSLRTLQKNVTRKTEELGKICNHNKYTIEYLLALSNAKRKYQSVEGESKDQDNDGMVTQGDDSDNNMSDTNSSVVDSGSESGTESSSDSQSVTQSDQVLDFHKAGDSDSD